MSGTHTSPPRLRRLRFVLAAAALFALAVGAAGATDRESQRPAPMLGTDFVQSTCGGARGSPYIVSDYNTPGVRREVILALHAMRAEGQESVGLFIWSAHDPLFWQIPSAEGQLTEPYRTNLIHLLSDIRNAGFKQVTATFQPLRTNDMKNWTGTYDPALFGENWNFIRDVRALVQQYGPASTHIDLLGEGAPSSGDLAHNSVWPNDLIRMYRNYVEAFGNEDVTISSIAKGTENWGTFDDAERMQNLIDLLRASGEPLPTWFAVSVAYDAGVLSDLRVVDEVLSRNGLSQPLVISEAGYNNAGAAGAIATFMATSKRPILELNEWPLYTPEIIRGQPADPPPRCASPPLRTDAYARALRGRPPSKILHAWVGAKGRLSLRTPYGQEVKALLTGRYTVVVRDTSAKHSFRLYRNAGGSLDRRTGIGFRGSRTWKINLGHPGSVTYASQGPRGTHRHFTMLVPG